MKRFLPIATGLLSAASLWAGPVVDFKQSQPEVRDIPLNVLRVQGDQTFQSEFKRHKGRSENEKSNDNTNTWHYDLELAHRIPLSGNWYLKLGIEWNRYDFGNNRSLAPNTLSSYAAEIALEYWVGNDIGFFIESKPGLYVAHDISWDAFDAPTNIVFAYPLVDQKFYLIGGVTMGSVTEDVAVASGNLTTSGTLTIAFLREYPVLPIGGVLWHINEKWDLRAYLPEPKLVYKPNQKWEIWGGGEIYGGAFRNDSRTDAGAKNLNHTPVEYYELRGGGGVSYLASDRMKLDLAAGYAFARKFDFYRPGIVQETQGAPYLRFAGLFEF